MRPFQREVENAMKKLATATYRLSCKKFAVPRCVGVPIPRLRTRCKKGFSFSDRSEKEQWTIWNFIFHHSRQHEAQTAALVFAERSIAPTPPHPPSGRGGIEAWSYLHAWMDKIDNWAHSDGLYKIYSFLLERHPALVYPVLKKWNVSTNPWKRRASVVSLIYYASPRRSSPPVQKILPLVRRLLHDPDPYVQKAVGWTLRECGTLYPVATWNFLVHHVRDLAAVSFSYATERLHKTKKNRLKKLRK